MRNMIFAAALILSAATATQAQSISAQRAREIALARVTNPTRIISEKLVNRHGLMVYEFDIDVAGRAHREIRVSAADGTVVADQKEDDRINPATSRTIPNGLPAPPATPNASSLEPYDKDDPPRNVAVSEASAREIALKQVPGGRIRDIDLEWENGLAIYEAEVVTPGERGHHKLHIDANSGKVILFQHKH